MSAGSAARSEDRAPLGDLVRGAAEVDLSAVAANTRTLADVAGVPVMAVVKADGYGHGMVAAARAAVAGGASWLGTALPAEARALRAAGLRDVPVLAWLPVPGEDWDATLAADVQVSASAPWTVAEVAAAARRTGVSAGVHLEADSGMSRGGATPEQWGALVEAARRAEADGDVEVVGLWGHLACADEPDHPANARQLERFAEMVRHARAAGLRPSVLHHANSAGALLLPASRLDLVRCGIALYGVSPAPQVGPAERFGLRGAMTLRGRLAHVKEVPPGEGVSYGHTETTTRRTDLGVVPLGYGDGVPRHGSGVLEVAVGGRRARVVGRVCMDQVVVDLGPGSGARAGDEVVLFGAGGPSADEWAAAAGTIGYEIVTRVGARVPRVHRGGKGPTW